MPDPADDFCLVPDDAPPLVAADRSTPVGRLDEGRCSVRALAAGDSPMATAPPARRWLLVEQPGPWGRDALLQSRFDAAVAPLLAARARDAGLRIQMVRRPGDRLSDSGRRWAVADVTPGGTWLRWSTRETDAELLDAPLDGSVGVDHTDPTYLVCTHGGHDACCAVRGRPLARALPAAGPADVWETSHLGGDRFAANVLVLPTGHVYGQVPGDGADLVGAHGRGEVLLDHLRGRAGLTPPAQAAQQLARAELGLLGVEDLPVRSVRALPAPDTGGERWAVTLGGPDGDLVLTLDARLSAESRLLTCAALRPGRWRTWHPVGPLAPVAPPV
ncbi:sucrase ferredoxin [Modestobacter sp. Leaf380]|uniref:sucrase ferredoxin n=1 Tax=Modestobacter sp. Leaf380 TaxID=1736356 RepID=UPI001F292172|nr:sucrase ferredoxin [Modestobacter sp. Leaf380]